MNQSRHSGDNHVIDVFNSLTFMKNTGSWSLNHSESALKTARYIWNKLPSVDSIQCKFEFEHPDKHHDLCIQSNQVIHNINLFFTQGTGNIQPKNLGAKSFLQKYFLAPELQTKFNTFFETEYLSYLSNIIDIKGHYRSGNDDLKELKKIVKIIYTKFDDNSNIFRNKFLYELREYCFSLLVESYNSYKEGFQNAFNELLLANDINIITRVKSNTILIEELAPDLSSYSNIKIFKQGNNSINIHAGAISLQLRFKFENLPNSSIKLATSYKQLKDEAEFKSKETNKNKKTLSRISQIESEIEPLYKDNTSNAIGKCHEAYAYYWMIHKFPQIIQTEDSDCISYLQNNLPYLDETIKKKIKESSSVTADVITKYIFDKYHSEKIECIQLVADIYISDKLNTGDLKLLVRTKEDKIEEVFISLKALKNLGQKITTKNPGIGTILGPTYFDIKDNSNTIEIVKEEFNKHQDHYSSLVKFSEEIGFALETANQANLRMGIENLLGKALMIVTYYNVSKSYYLEHHNINGSVKILRDTPSKIQNTLIWNNDSESLSLRVKFSRSQKYGWSTVKLTAEYNFKFPDK